MSLEEADFQLRGLRDPRLAPHATSSHPAWLWASDGTRLIWCNAAGAAVFGSDDPVALTQRRFGAADQHRRQVARLAGRLALDESLRLERLRGFGAPLGRLLTVGCRRLVFPERQIGVLLAAAEPPARPLPLTQRLARLIAPLPLAVAAFDPAGGLRIGANDAAHRWLDATPTGGGQLAGLGLTEAAALALRDGHSEAAVGDTALQLQRVGSGADTVLLVLVLPTPVRDAAPPQDTASETDPATAPATPPVIVVPPEPEPEAPAVAAAPAPALEPIVDEPPAARMAAGPESVAPQTIPTPLPAALAPAPPTALPWPTLSPALASAIIDAPAFSIASDGAEPETRPAEASVAPAEVAAPVDVAPAAAAPDPQPAVAEPAPPVAPIETPPSAVAVRPAPQDAPAAPPDAEPPPVADTAPVVHAAEQALAPPTSIAPPVVDAPATPEPAPVAPRRHPLRFLWQIDAEGRFSLASDEFTALIGPSTAAALGQPWSEIAARFGLDPDGRVAAAMATRDTWSGITVQWPADGSAARLAVELSGLPAFDRIRTYLGYRGFGVCRDLEALDRLAQLRRAPAPPPDAAPAATPSSAPSSPPATDRAMETPPNVVPFRPAGDVKAPTLSPGENNAFNELARQLAARLEAEREALDRRDRARALEEADGHAAPPEDEPASEPAAPPVAPAEQPPVWLSAAAAPPVAGSDRDVTLFDRMPVGVLVYRLDRLLYANAVFLAHAGYGDIATLAAAGGLDALYVEPVSGGDSTSRDGMPVRISGRGPQAQPQDARLHSIVWDGEPAHALIFAPAAEAAPQPVPPPVVTPPVAAPAPAAAAPDATEQDLQELAAILDACDDGIVLVEQDGSILSCNRGAEVMFGGDRAGQPLTTLFAADAAGTLAKALAAAGDGPDHARHLLARADGSGEVEVKIGRSPAGRRFAICRPQPVATPAAEPAPRRAGERGAEARAEILTRLSHELRAPLAAVNGFADVMIEERFGPIGNERYAAYLKDLRAAGERVLAIVNDFLDLSRAETGKLDLAFARHDLNEVVETCVTIMQPQANRERIIIRTALAHALPPVTADANSLKQIVLNLVGNSIHVARAGGQVIVSTAQTELGEVVLRVRDSGRGLSHAEMETALEQFRNPDAERLAQDNAGINLSLTRALAEANHAQFNIRSAPQSGTLVEVAFPPLAAKAG
jgi:signal transduction histidine kinase